LVYKLTFSAAKAAVSNPTKILIKYVLKISAVLTGSELKNKISVLKEFKVEKILASPHDSSD
jgi:hypothetical protein